MIRKARDWIVLTLAGLIVIFTLLAGIRRHTRRNDR